MTIILMLLAVVAIGAFVMILVKEMIHLSAKCLPSSTRITRTGHAGLLLYIKNIFRSVASDYRSREGRRGMLLLSLAISAALLILTSNLLFAVFSGAAAYAAIMLYFKSRENKRMELFNEQLIDGLGIIKNAVSAGQSLMQALDTLVINSQPPLCDAFARVLREARLGVPLSQALDSLSRETNSRDLRLAVLSLNLAKDSGGNISEILNRLSATMRERNKIKGKIRSLTAQGKASGIVMSCMPFLLLCVLYCMQPEIMGLLFTTLPGNIMLAIVCIMVALGAFFIDRITKIDI